MVARYRAGQGEKAMNSQQKLIKASAELIEYLHKIVLEYQITEPELRQVIDFLTRVGQQNEFQLLSDVLGISVIVDDITYGQEHDGTDHNVEGPLYRADAPLRTPPVKLCSDDEEGDLLFMSGQVIAAADNHPLAHAMLDVWQTNQHGYYENQDESQADYNLRGRFLTDEHGSYQFQTIVPGAYEVTRGGPVGDLLLVLGRHAWRPSHIHFKVTCDGFAPLTTMLFMPGDPWLQSDTINAVKESLIVKLEKHDSPEEMRQRGIGRPFYTCHYDFALKEAVAETYNRIG
jgi:protocatechuate 3,4-dioxygenase beta subunit